MAAAARTAARSRGRGRRRCRERRRRESPRTGAHPARRGAVEEVSAMPRPSRRTGASGRGSEGLG
eukprot:5747962-Prymnesium_polylepis.1